MTLVRSLVLGLGLLVTSASQAGVLEELLSKPAIQALLGRQPDLQATIKRCADTKYRQANAIACQQAEQADRLAKMPPELRAVLAVPSSAASIRELCLAAQAGPQKNSYLCAELSKADSSFQVQTEQQRKAAAAAAAAAEAEAQRRAADTFNDRQIK